MNESDKETINRSCVMKQYFSLIELLVRTTC